METTEPTEAACVSCGRPAIVTVMGDAGGAFPAPRQYCLDCAEKRQEPAGGMGTVVAPFIPSLLIRVGAVIGILALAADYLHIAGKSGFGWKQMAGTEIGALALTLGAFLRVGFLTVAGLVLVALSLGADYLGVGHSPGLGWRQQVAIPVSIACVAVGLLLQRHESRQRQGLPPQAPVRPAPGAKVSG